MNCLALTALKVHDLESVLKTNFAADFRTYAIDSKSVHPPESQVSHAIGNFYFDFEGQNALYVVYYAGHGWEDESAEGDGRLKLGEYVDNPTDRRHVLIF